MNEYIDKLNMYLPIDFADEENNAYRQYLIESFHENCEKGKHQFALMAFHMLFMSFLYKEFWELKQFSFSKVQGLCKSDAKFNGINNIFEASIIPEKTMIDQYLSIHSWHVNKKNAVKEFVDKRDNCAHASGFIQYDASESERIYLDVLDQAQKISQANKQNVVDIIQKKLIDFIKNEDEFNAKTSGEFISDLIREVKISPRDISYVLSADTPQIVTDDTSGIFIVAYFFAMLQLHSGYLQNSVENTLNIPDEYFADRLYLYLDTLDADRKLALQVQVEDEMEYLNACGTLISVGKLSDIW